MNRTQSNLRIFLTLVFGTFLASCEGPVQEPPVLRTYYIPKAEDFYALMKRAETGDGSAELDIALYELMGREDTERAKYWFERASSHGEKRADGHLEAMKPKRKDQ